MGHLLLQLGLAAIMFTITAISGLASIKVTRKVKETARGKTPKTLSLLSCFAGGVFLATCFLDILPHVNENFERFKKDSSFDTSFAIPELFVCVGFFAVFALEEVCTRLFSDQHVHHRECPADEITLNVVHGNGQVRNCEVETSCALLVNPSKEGVFHAVVLAIAMSFHSILEGLALGVQSSYSEIMTLFTSLILHKGIEAFSVGLQISRSSMDRLRIVLITIMIYSLMTPLGSLIGTSIWNSDFDRIAKGGTIVVLEGLAVGTFLYVTFLEVIAVERANEHSNIYQLLATFCGFVLIAVFQLAEQFIKVQP